MWSGRRANAGAVDVPLAMGANHNLVCRVPVDTLNVDALSEQDMVCRLQLDRLDVDGRPRTVNLTL
jgi:hypothetical protein